MRRALLAVVSLAALAACNPNASRQGEQNPAAQADGAFPSLINASYRAEGTILADDGRTMPVVTIRDGRKFRMELASGEGDIVIINNPDAGETLSIINRGGQRVAMRHASSLVRDPSEYWNAEVVQSATLVGPCSGAGEQGREWSRQEDGVAQTACVTQDGIILYAAKGGVRSWETTKVERGPQSADLFTAPPGIQVMDLNNIPGMADAIEKMRAQSDR